MAGYTGGGGISGAGSGNPGTIGIWDAIIIHDMLSVDRPIHWRFNDDEEIPDVGTGGIGGPGTAGGGPDCGPVINIPPVREPIVWDRHLLDTLTAARRSRAFEGLDVVPRESETATQLTGLVTFVCLLCACMHACV